MYFIVYTDLDKKDQRIIDRYPYLLEANEACLIHAEKFVISKEGVRYLTKPIWLKSEIIKHGHYITESKANFHKKYNIFKKERNGIIYSGELKKIGYFQVFKTDSAVNSRELCYRKKKYLIDPIFEPVINDIENHKSPILQKLEEGIIIYDPLQLPQAPL